MAPLDWTDWRATRARSADASGYVERDGVRTHWETFGSGDPAVLLLPTWSVLHAAHGRFQIADLARDHRVITFDGRGNGRSDRPAGAAAYDDREFVADALAVLDATGTRAAVAVACSQAGYWLLRLAAEHPDRVLGAVFSGTNLPIASGYGLGAGNVPFDAPYVSTDGWARWNAAYWRDHYEDFLRFFFSQVWVEPHSVSIIERSVAWGLETTPETLIDTALAPGLEGPDEALGLAAMVTCPVLVIHGDRDALTPVERGARLADATQGQLVVLGGAGHCPGNRDPVKFNTLVRELVDSVAGRRPAPARWARGPDRPRRVLVVPGSGRPEVVRRDLAIVRALRARVPGVSIEWLVGRPARTWLDERDEAVLDASDALLAERRIADSGIDPRDLAGSRSIDEALFADFMVFAEVVARESFDLVLADEAWQVDHYLHQNPEVKRFAFAWLTDAVGWRRGAGESPRDALLREDANAEMVEAVDRYPRVRDVSLFLGDPDRLPDWSLGAELPSVRAWTLRHFDVCPSDASDPVGAAHVADRLRTLV